MVRVLKAFFPAVLLAYVLASVISTQMILGNVQAMGVPVGPGDRLGATGHDLIGMTSSYLPLILVAFVLGLPVAAGLARWLPRQRALLFVTAGFVAIVAMHLIMKAVLGISGVPVTRTVAGLFGQGLAGAAGGYCYYLISREGGPSGLPRIT